MKKFITLAATTSLALSLGTGFAAAQSALTGTKQLNDAIDTSEKSVKDDLAKGEDAGRFGSERFSDRWVGSVAGSGSITTGNTNTTNLAAAGRFRRAIGDWNHTFGFSADYGWGAGALNKRKLFGVYDANRDINDRAYVFALGRTSVDAFGSLTEDTFVGFGPGYRIVNRDDLAWRIQAGPGMRFTRDNTGVYTRGFSAIASSRLYVSLSDRSFLSNDTDILNSSAGVLVTNDAGITYRLSDNLSARVSYNTTYNSRPTGGAGTTDNTLRVSVVYAIQ